MTNHKYKEGAPHEYGRSTVGHGEAQCIWCKGTNRELAIIAPNHCQTRQDNDPKFASTDYDKLPEEEAAEQHTREMSGYFEAIKEEDFLKEYPMEAIEDEDAKPKPDALAPNALSQELTNLMVAKCGGKISRAKAEQVVEAQLEKLATYYAQAATDSPPEVANTNQAMLFNALQTLQASANAVIARGAGFTYMMSKEDHEQWIRNAGNLRGSISDIMKVLA